MFEFLMALPGYILPFLFVLTTVVFFHELGHFLVARWCGVYVEAFSIGFGREIFGWNDRHGTRWKVAWLPLGGYVKMLGEEDDMLGGLTGGESDVPNLESQSSVKRARQEGCYNKKNVYARLAISSAGPFANFILAVVVFWGIFSVAGIRVVFPQVETVVAGSAAEAAGFQTGDIIRFLDGREIDNFLDIQRAVLMSAGTALVFEVERGGEMKRIVATPLLSDIKDNFGNSHRAGVLGIGSTQVSTRLLGPVDALVEGVERMVYVSSATLSYLGQLVVGDQGVSNLAGPLRIAHISSLAADNWIALLSLVGVLSVSLGILNLLPIPVLDGGHILFYLIEAIKGSPLSERVQEYSMRAGMVLLLGLMVFVMVNDVLHLSSGLG